MELWGLGCFPEGLRRKGLQGNATIVWDLFSPGSFWLRSQLGDKANIDTMERSSLTLHQFQNFRLESQDFLKSTEEVEAKFGYF